MIDPIVLEARATEDGEPLDLPPVRIWVGSEPAQHRPERVFVYAITKVRNPRRRYELYLMKDLPGFGDPGRWHTGFTNYRFTVPQLAGGHGRAIYNDADQIWFADPAGLFDADLNGHGYLALTPTDTAVMLIDCARLAPVWNLEAARSTKKKQLHAAASSQPGCFGVLEADWHARDMEFRPGRSRLLHYTFLPWQPWRPEPDRLTYEPHPHGEQFLSLEREADAQGFEVYDAARPSAGFAAAAAMLDAAGVVEGWTGEGPSVPIALESLREPPGATFDRITARDLEQLPADDLPWVVDALFARAREHLSLAVGVRAQSGAAADAGAWHQLLQRMARRHPQCHWQLDVRDTSGNVHRNGAAEPHEPPPKVWLLLGDHTGDNAQLVAIADALGWPWEGKRARCEAWRYRLNMAAGGGLSRRLVADVEPPWPDVVLNAGRRTAPLARWIRHRSGGRAKLVQVGRSQLPQSRFDLVVTTPQFGAPLDAGAVALPAPYVAPRVPEAALLERWQARLSALPRPWVALLVGGDAQPCRLDAAVARRIGAEASAAVAALGGSLLVSTSRRTPATAADALMGAIGASTVPHIAYRAGSRDENPYLTWLALADAFVVTGDSITMLAETRLTGRPVAVAELPLARNRKNRIRHAFERWAGIVEREPGPRGTPPQQRRLARLYLAAVGAGLVRRERRFGLVHAALDVRPIGAGLLREPGEAPRLLRASQARLLDAIRDLVREDGGGSEGRAAAGR